MTTLASASAADPDRDDIVWLNGVSWRDYMNLLAMRGDRSGPRISYLEGTVEIMSPSRQHEALKSWISRLVDAWCFHHRIRCSAYGSWTLKDGRRKRGVEPDECYIFGTEDADRPHLAIEVVWTHGALDKLEVYRKLGVREVWVWEDGRIRAFGLRGEHYEVLPGSEVLPGLDLNFLASFLDRPTMYDAVADFRSAL